MSKRIHYSQDEWLALAKAPTHVALAVMGASETSPFQMVRELISLGDALRQTEHTASAGALVRELNIETQAQLLELSQQPSLTIDLSGLRAPALEACRRVAAIVESREASGDANEYKRWVLWLARQVAAAAREGAGSAISADEAALLDELGEALGLQQSRAAAAEQPVEPALQAGGEAAAEQPVEPALQVGGEAAVAAPRSEAADAAAPASEATDQ